MVQATRQRMARSQSFKVNDAIKNAKNKLLRGCMKKINMPFYFRMQNFMFIDKEIFWTSATKTIWQKIKKLLGRTDGDYCNTSGGFVIPGHGQDVFYDDGAIVTHKKGEFKGYAPSNGELLTIETGKAIPGKLKYSGLLQGYAYKKGLFTHAIFGKASKESILVFETGVEKVTYVAHYNDHKKWWWKHWEAEGIQWHEEDLYIGISVKSKFGFICNYIKKL